MSTELTLKQQRQAIHDGMVARRGNWKDNRNERRDIGNAMIERRTGKKLVDDINSLTKPETSSKTLQPAPSRGGIGTSIGVGPYVPSGSGSAGTAGPFTENDYSKREWWPAGLPSSDGLMVYPAEKKVVMTDGNGAEVVFNYAEPTL